MAFPWGALPPGLGRADLLGHFILRDSPLSTLERGHLFTESLSSKGPAGRREAQLQQDQPGPNKGLVRSPQVLIHGDASEAVPEPLCPSNRCHPKASRGSCESEHSDTSHTSLNRVIPSASGARGLLDLLLHLPAEQEQGCCLQEQVEKNGELETLQQRGSRPDSQAHTLQKLDELRRVGFPSLSSLLAPNPVGVFQLSGTTISASLPVSAQRGPVPVSYIPARHLPLPSSRRSDLSSVFLLSPSGNYD